MSDAVLLADVCTLITKGTTPTTAGGRFTDSGINFIKSESLSYQGNIDKGKFAFIDPATHSMLKRSQIAERDILYSIAGANLGKCGMATADILPANTNQAVAIIRVDPKKASPEFVSYVLRDNSFVQRILNGVAQSAQPNVNLGDIGRFRLPKLTLDRQEKIAALLKGLDDKIELNRRINETLEAMAQAIFRDWFVDFGPTRRKLEGATDPIIMMGGLIQDADRAKALSDLFPATLADDELPEGWEEKQVGDVVVLLKRGLAPSYSGNGILVINQKCIRNKAVNLAVARRHDVAKRPPRDRLLEEYDVVVNSTGVGTLGRVATVRGLEEEATADSHVTICRADTSKVSKLILSLFMEGQEAFIETMGHGSTGQTELSPASLSAMAFTVAPAPVQLAFDNLVMPLRNLVTSNSAHSLTLSETRDLLLPKLMSGEIRLGEAVEAAA